MQKNQRIHFHFLTKGFPLAERQRLKNFIDKLLGSERKIEHVSYIFCSDNYLLRLNKDYLRHTTLTDIVTFELSDRDEPLLADIYISVDRVRENAKQFETSFKEELHRVIFHGALHLLGFKDKSKQQARQMRKMEEGCLNKYFVSRETRQNLNKFPVKH